MCSAGVASRFLAFFAAGPGGAAAALDPFPGLTEREREILDLVARELTDADARRLVVSDETVRNHVSNVFTELQVAPRAERVGASVLVRAGRASDASSAGRCMIRRRN